LKVIFVCACAHVKVTSTADIRTTWICLPWWLSGNALCLNNYRLLRFILVFGYTYRT